ncbi:hypothetical protein PACTADRAFT_47732 [Pachysolen tannophilus NRRL Y-2460]|uniref:21S rRNA pseudouridine(2819) synthase n=1 Tax=Pachysolen tannophilus NRRL Y-2460 TaxID=669874 RepID=A0A1E4U1L1_PACTA|nr:hypothetical protein PACTADRAFT_47732 [Pachysolen tannophilus NRRL Y-2460]
MYSNPEQNELLPLLASQYSYLNASNLQLVHRLDNFVTGGMLISKDKNSAKNFSKYLRNKSVDNNENKGWAFKRRYVAVVDKPSLIDSSYVQITKERNYIKGLVDRPIDDKDSITKFILPRKSPFEDKSLIILELVTGRKHQIRKHLQFLDLACLNDSKFGSTYIFDKADKRQIGLHSSFIQIQIGLQEPKKFLIPILYGKKSIWNGFIDANGYFPEYINKYLFDFDNY